VLASFLSETRGGTAFCPDLFNGSQKNGRPRVPESAHVGVLDLPLTSFREAASENPHLCPEPKSVLLAFPPSNWSISFAFGIWLFTGSSLKTPMRIFFSWVSFNFCFWTPPYDPQPPSVWWVAPFRTGAAEDTSSRFNTEGWW